MTPTSTPKGAESGFQDESAAAMPNPSAAKGSRSRPGIPYPRSSAPSFSASRFTIRAWAASASESVSVRSGAR